MTQSTPPEFRRFLLNVFFQALGPGDLARSSLQEEEFLNLVTAPSDPIEDWCNIGSAPHRGDSGCSVTTGTCTGLKK